MRKVTVHAPATVRLESLTGARVCALQVALKRSTSSRRITLLPGAIPEL